MTTIKEKREEIRRTKLQIQRLEAKIRILRMEIVTGIRECNHKWKKLYNDYGEIYYMCSLCDDEREEWPHVR
jgi:hypothetical protein